MLIGIGLVTTVRVALSPELRRSIIEAVAEHLPQELLDELVLDADVVPDSDDAEPEATDPEGETAGAAEAEASQAVPQGGPRRANGGQRRRNVSRARGDTNGRGGRKPPNRGTRA